METFADLTIHPGNYSASAGRRSDPHRWYHRFHRQPSSNGRAPHGAAPGEGDRRTGARAESGYDVAPRAQSLSGGTGSVSPRSLRRGHPRLRSGLDPRFDLYAGGAGSRYRLLHAGGSCADSKGATAGLARLQPPEGPRPSLLIDVVGPNYPGPSDERGYLAARQRAVVLAPESPEAAYWLGDSFFHEGQLLQLPDWQGRAIAGFERAIQLDSAYPQPYPHLIEIKLQQGDTVGIRALAATYFAMDSAGEYRDFLRWRVAVGLADSAGLTALRAQFRGMSTESLFRIAAQAQVEGIELSDAELAARSLAAQAGDDGRWTTAAYVMEGLASNEGRPAAALAATAFMTADQRRPLADRWFRVADAIYTDGDSIAAEHAIGELTPLADGPTEIRPGASDSQNVATCAVALWRMHRADTLHVRSAIHRLRGVPPAEHSGLGVWMNACATILEAQLAALAPDVRYAERSRSTGFASRCGCGPDLPSSSGHHAGASPPRGTAGKSASGGRRGATTRE